MVHSSHGPKPLMSEAKSRKDVNTMTLEEIKEGLLTAGEQELLSVDEIISIVVKEMEYCKDTANKLLLSRRFSLDYKILNIQAKEAQIYAYANFLEEIGVNEIYLAILKDSMSLCYAESVLQKTKTLEREKGGEINAYRD